LTSKTNLNFMETINADNLASRTSKLRDKCQIDVKTLNTFINLERRSDRLKVVNYLGFQTWKEYYEQFNILS